MGITRWIAAALAASAPVVCTQAADRVSLWTNQAPVGDGSFEAAQAFVTAYLPPARNANGAAVIICPGGGYAGLVINAEGHNIARWVNQHGIAGIVLQYRLPKGRPLVPLLDAQRAVRTVRARSAGWGIRPDKVGLMGFSAGGHLAASAAIHFDAGRAEADDPIERQSCRPDFAILIYPVITMGGKTEREARLNLLGRQPSAESVDFFSCENQVTSETPPMFLVHSLRDNLVSAENSRLMQGALLAHDVPVEYMELTTGGNSLSALWGDPWDSIRFRMLAWLAGQKVIPEKDANSPPITH